MKQNRFSKVLALSFIATVPCVNAADKFWNPATLSGDWDLTTSNWSAASGGTPDQLWVASDSAFFNQAGTYSVNVAGDRTATAVNISAGNVTLTGSGISTGTLVASGVGTSSKIESVLSGISAITKSGSGTLELAGNNTFTGGISIPGTGGQAVGWLRLSNNNALGIGTKTISLTASTSGATGGVELIGGVTIAAKNLQLGGRSTNNSALRNVSGSNVWSGNITLNGPGGSYFIESQAGLLQLSGNLNNTIGNSRRDFVLIGAGDFLISGTVKDNSATVTTGLVNNSTGTTTLTGTNLTYTGGTAVNSGTLLVNGTHNGGGTVNGYTVGVAGSLGGTGIINTSTVTTAAGSKLLPGGTANTGNLRFTLTDAASAMNIAASTNGTGAYIFDLAAPIASDKITLTLGTLNIGNMTNLDFVFNELSGFDTGTYVLFDAASPITGSVTSLQNSILFTNGRTGTLSVDTTNNNVVLSVVPEPSTFAMLLGVGILTLVRRRRA